MWNFLTDLCSAKTCQFNKSKILHLEFIVLLQFSTITTGFWIKHPIFYLGKKIQIIMKYCDNTEINTVIKATLWGLRIHSTIIFLCFILFLQSYFYSLIPTPLDELCFWALAIIFLLGMFPNSIRESAYKKPSSSWLVSTSCLVIWFFSG